LFTFGLSAVIASVGGSLLAIYAGAAQPSSYQALDGLVWLAVIVTFGAQTSNAAMFAGLAFVFAANLVSVYLPSSWATVPAIAFGLGAVLVAMDPEGSVAALNRQLRKVGRLAAGLITRRGVDVGYADAVPESAESGALR
jgi:branched-chain amino acid transport system permease protein